MPTSKNTKSGNPTRKELEAYMNKRASVMHSNHVKMPIAPGQGFKSKTSSALNLIIPEIRDMAQRAREKKLANEFRHYMENAKTHSIKKRLGNLNKSSPKAKTQSIKRLDNLDLEEELSDEKWYGGKKRRKQKTKKHKKKQKTRKNRKKSKK